MKGRIVNHIERKLTDFTINEYGDILSNYQDFVTYFKNEEQDDGSFRFVGKEVKKEGFEAKPSGSNIFGYGFYPLRIRESYHPNEMIWEYYIVDPSRRFDCIVYISNEEKEKMRRKYYERSFVMAHVNNYDYGTSATVPKVHLGTDRDTDWGSYDERLDF